MDSLHVGARALGSEPLAILASELQRDRSFAADDVVRIVLDAFNRRSEGYMFEINSRGTRRDVLIESGDDLVLEWDAPWRGNARVTEIGWEAEIRTQSMSIFSRSIGLNQNRQPVDLEAGAKLTERTGPCSFGMLRTRTTVTDSQEAQGYTVIRGVRQIADESSLGLLYTNGEPRAEGDNHVFGFDVNLRDSQ